MLRYGCCLQVKYNINEPPVNRGMTESASFSSFIPLHCRFLDFQARQYTYMLFVDGKYMLVNMNMRKENIYVDFVNLLIVARCF